MLEDLFAKVKSRASYEKPAAEKGKMNIPENTTTRIPASSWHAIFYDHFDGISQLLY